MIKIIDGKLIDTDKARMVTHFSIDSLGLVAAIYRQSGQYYYYIKGVDDDGQPSETLAPMSKKAAQDFPNMIRKIKVELIGKQMNQDGKHGLGAIMDLFK